MLRNRQVHEARQTNRRAKPHKMTDKAIKGRFDERLDFDDEESIVEFPLLLGVFPTVEPRSTSARICMHSISEPGNWPHCRICG